MCTYIYVPGLASDSMSALRTCGHFAHYRHPYPCTHVPIGGRPGFTNAMNIIISFALWGQTAATL